MAFFVYIHISHNIYSTQLDGWIVLNEHYTVFTWKRSTICKRCFPGPTWVLDANSISITSAVLQGSLCDRPTDRPCYSVYNNRWHVSSSFQFTVLFFHVRKRQLHMV